MDIDLGPVYTTAFVVGTTLALLALFRIGQRIASPKHTAVADLADANAARHLLRVGQVLGVFLVASAAVKNCVSGDSLMHDVFWVSVFGATGLLLLAASGHLGVRLLLQQRLPREIERGNVAAGLAAGAHYVATGIVTSFAMAGDDLASLGLSLVFFVIGQATLHLFDTLFRALTTYDDAEQIAGENLAAAMSYGGLAIAVAIILARALEGTFSGWGPSLKAFAGVLLGGLALYPVRQIFVQTIVLGAPFKLRGGRLDTAIAAEHSPGLGALEAVTYIATALSIARLA
jgi:uncharacterized membrane protein YjfL (UPF0719 family)